MKNIIIKQATLDDKFLIGEFYKTSFENPQFKFYKRWEWIYINNPFLNRNKFLPIWLAMDQDRIVGMACLMPQNFCVNKQNVSISWCHDFRVLPECRGLGVGSRLEKARRESGDLFSFASSYQSVIIKKKLGYLSKPSNTTFLHVRRFDKNKIIDDLLRYAKIKQTTVFKKISNTIRIDHIISLLLTIIYRYKQNTNITNNYNRISLTFKKVDHFKEEVNALWNKISNNYTIAVVRDAKYLNWKFVDQPHIKYQRYLIYSNSGLCGVLIFRNGLKPELPIGTISEFYSIHQSDVLRQILSFAISKLYSQGSIMIRCGSSTKERSDVLKSIGFLPIRKNLITFSFRSKKLKNITERVLDEDWLMGLGDQDCDEYPQIRHPSLKDIILSLMNHIPGEELINKFK